ncbi:MAG TPA: DUF1080 domain-containing protein [Candidatus Paceibacterota bacterium]|nr:DUF1080 domain-containing protein [Verrucomicrobiota bacterium]HRY48737.1 DUF1080 domain-containing protein [Candidatus Paceibacterota bacterium]HSA02714.1 DUF1080 domain-containing protein [Candidatus Paceibacterota bacterium]
MKKMFPPLARALAIVLPLALVSPPAIAAEKPSNILPPQEVADGWIQLFDGETLFGWAPRGDARWEVREGAIHYVPGSGGGFLCTTTEFADFKLHTEFWIDDQANSGIFLRGPAQGELALGNVYEVNLFDAHEKWPTGSINEVAKARAAQKTAGRWNDLDITAEGDHLRVTLNGETTVDARDSKLSRGILALQNYQGKGHVRFRNLKLKPLGLTSIFNGKDLTGWKEIPGRKSVYSVTPEGWLNVKNGNGDLQSETEYGDFVFQLEIISNGTHLNSGVFFRAIRGEFWSGYESQIRNQWEGDNRAKPVDYGTGGLYNRQPARRVVSNDREWFTQTIVAQGPHLATWVNGVQVTDFTDTRPPQKSARQGYRAEAGVLSLQGHDPTTDLSFRNLRIVELPPARP